jgi:hypothetical protein
MQESAFGCKNVICPELFQQYKSSAALTEKELRERRNRKQFVF